MIKNKFSATLHSKIEISHSTIEVTCAIITDGSMALAVQRGVESSHPLKWEFPGGKIQAKETAVQCIVREITEELGVQIDVLERLKSVDFDYGEKQIRLIPFVCRISSGKIALTEHIAQSWFNFNQWQKIDWQEADRELILKNLDVLQR